MTIGRKLNLGIFIIISGFLSAFIFLGTNVSRSSALKERQIEALAIMNDLNEVRLFTLTLLVSNSMSLDKRIDDWKTARETFEASLAALSAHSRTNGISEGYLERLMLATSTWQIMKARFEQTEALLAGLTDPAVLTLVEVQGVIRANSHITLNPGNAYSPAAAGILGTVTLNLSGIDLNGGEAVLRNLNEMSGEISVLAESTTSRTFLISTAISLVIVLGALLLVFRFSRDFAAKVRELEHTMHLVSERDVSVRLRIRGKDELASLGGYINSVLTSINAFMLLVQKTVLSAGNLKDSLSTGTGQSVVSLNQISRSISSIRDQFVTLSTTIRKTTESVMSIGSRINAISINVEHQTKAVSDTSSSIEEMTAGIQNVAHLSEERRKRSNDLLEIIRDGGEKVEATNTLIGQISREVQDILEIIDIINSIAEQTNLLSMNAAIESAHAGEAGKGFAVVAEEIRKLADSTSDNASRIGSSLQSITGKITGALSASERSYRSFENITQDVQAFAEAMAEISSSMEELSSAGTSVLAATAEVSTLTKEIREGSREINADSREILTEMRTAENISAEATAGIEEIDRGAREILQALKGVSRVSNENRERMQTLSQVVQSFRTVDNAADMAGHHEYDELEAVHDTAHDAAGVSEPGEPAEPEISP